MTLAILFWLLMILWLLFGWQALPPASPDRPAYWRFGGFGLLWVLLALLGYSTFGSPIKG